MRKLVEGCYLVDVFSDVYAVKGLVHPPGRIYAVPRIIEGVKVKSVREGFAFVAEKNPAYVFQDPYLGRPVIAVPETSVKQPIYPSKAIKGPPRLVEAAIQLSHILSDAGVEHGFTGSLLLGTADEKSDIDIVIYGDEKHYRAVKKLRQQDILKPVDAEAIQILSESRLDTPKALPTIETERRKILTGKYAGFLYTMKIIPETSWENRDDTAIIPEKPYETTVEIVDDSFSFYTPCRYGVRNIGGELEVVEVISFRSRFSEMGVRGDRLTVRGLLERVVKPGRLYHRLNVGLDADDFMEPVNRRPC
ncbi:MAG: nucleotidyltransferase domain-containing protein [Candidatus Caldarchaeum sp.]|nr:nucleotidyltransferase domain-containing protein [Candidatus Caldarchaeum sp.]MCX8200567.1 nucleotidyltransferase domain-containing protein [Candidatus Caldarchaeum sp.]MDW8063473.1 nucleotidyltransferase domain-containing protein [Candidatus Caldarchaeum sp.]MDW8435001.1 nucleotidyltransferase domain-containing protein [Candidatus Caldarchaeum sp.]